MSVVGLAPRTALESAKTRWISLVTGLYLALAGAAPMAAAEMDGRGKTIEGTIRIHSDLAGHVDAGDRLIIKLFHPGDGVDLDARFQILDQANYPLDFGISPLIDMNGRTKFDAYMVEAFTDKDGDVLAVAPGEVVGRTDDLVPLGTTGLVIEMDRPRD